MDSDFLEIAFNNKLILKLYSIFLNDNPRAITKEMVEDLATSCHIDNEYAMYLLFVSYLGFDVADNLEHDTYCKKYILPYLKRLNQNDYLNNPYVINVLPKTKKLNNWEIKYLKYAPYELFIWKDLTINDHYEEFPNIGYFTEEFKYLCVLEDNREWMLITPNEIETMALPIENAFGNVITYGLGLGYFAYMASNKESVKSVTIIEKDQNVINLFNQEIKPFFKHQDKIKIIKSDAFIYASKMKNENYDFCFVDLWHDTSDGVECYLKFKQYEKYSKTTLFMYWIEESLISALRWYVFDNIDNINKNIQLKNDLNLTELLDKKNILKILKK